MLHLRLLAAAATLAAVAGLWPASGGGRPQIAAAETINVPGAPGGGPTVMSQTVLDPSHRYHIVVSGTVSYWCESADPNSCFWPDVPSHPTVELAGVDALWCYAAWRCPTPQLWKPLSVDGVGFDDFAGDPGGMRYDSSHQYSAVVEGVSGHLALRDEASTQTGNLQVTITDLGPIVAPTTVHFAYTGALIRLANLRSPSDPREIRATGLGTFTIREKLQKGIYNRADEIGAQRIVTEVDYAGGSTSLLRARFTGAKYEYSHQGEGVALSIRVTTATGRQKACIGDQEQVRLSDLPDHPLYPDFILAPYCFNGHLSTAFIRTYGPAATHAPLIRYVGVAVSIVATPEPKL